MSGGGAGAPEHSPLERHSVRRCLGIRLNYVIYAKYAYSPTIVYLKSQPYEWFGMSPQQFDWIGC
jgi:hypothetical protein